MAATRLDEIAIRALVPRNDPVGVVCAELLRRACGDRLVTAIDQAAETLRALDPNAYWVIRELPVHAAVPVSETDPDAQAQRIAEALVAVIQHLVRRGPNPDIVRFATTAEYGAWFVRALIGGAAGSWIYQRLGGLRALRPAAALVAAATALEVNLLDLFASFSATGGLTRLLLTATEPELVRLDATLLAAAGSTTPVPRRLLEAARAAVAGPTLLTGTAAVSRAGRRLELLGRLIATYRSAPELVAAVHATVPESTAPQAANYHNLWSLASEPRTDVEPTSASDRVHDVTTFATAGAVCFLLLPDFDGLMPPESALALRTPAAADLRRTVLAAVLGPGVSPHDPAVALAAGPTDPDHDMNELIPTLRCWVEQLREDAILGWKHPDDAAWFAGWPPVVGDIANALLRRFAAHLRGFQRSSATYLAERVMVPGGIVVCKDDTIQVELRPAPLQIVLSLAGLDTFAISPAWSDYNITVTHGGPQ